MESKDGIIVSQEKENVERRGHYFTRKRERLKTRSLFHTKERTSKDGGHHFTRKRQRLKAAVIISHEKENV